MRQKGSAVEDYRAFAALREGVSVQPDPGRGSKFGGDPVVVKVYLVIAGFRDLALVAECRAVGVHPEMTLEFAGGRHYCDP